DGFPKWTLESEIPATLHTSKDTLPNGESPDGMPLCYVRVAALVIPPECYQAAHGDAEFFVKHFRDEEAASNSNMKLRESISCGHVGHKIDSLETIVFRLHENGGAIFSSEQVDAADNGMGFVFAVKPLKIDHAGCFVTYVMQGVDDWTPAERAQ